MGKPLLLVTGVLLALTTASEIQPAEAAARPESLAITQEEQREVAITIYNGNLGLVKDVREVKLPQGVNEVKFMNVAAQIDPTTVHLKSLTEPLALRILEQNYEYDLLNPQKLMDKYVGRKVKLSVADGAIIEATLLSNNQGPIYEINGQIHLGHHGRVILPEMPKDLIPNPTLVWLMQNSSPRAHTVEASYLTSGITWKADYVVALDEKDHRGDLSGWVTIDNRSGATYENAALKLVAGDVHRAPKQRELYDAMAKAARAELAAPAPGSFREEGFFEYHLYTLQGRTTVKDNQTKQISLLSASDIPIVKQLIYYGTDSYYRNQYGAPISNQKVGVYLEVANKEENRLGLPLPKGVIRVYKADSEGSLQFIGEDTIDHTPKDEKVKIKMGEAFDVVGERTQKDWRKLGSSLYEVEWEISLRNHKQEDIQVTLIEPMPGDWEVLRSTHPYEKVEAHTLAYKVNVPKDGQTKVNYRVRIRF